MPTADEIAIIELRKCLFFKPQESVDYAEQRTWLESQVNERGGYVTTFNDFITEKGCNDDTKDFLYLAAEVLEDGNIVDFDLETILEITETVAFQNQTCLKKKPFLDSRRFRTFTN